MVKKKSKLNSEKIRTKKLKEKKVNPFELKVIKSKRDTLNTKIRKHQISKPGQSRVKNRQIQVCKNFYRTGPQMVAIIFMAGTKYAHNLGHNKDLICVQSSKQ